MPAMQPPQTHLLRGDGASPSPCTAAGATAGRERCAGRGSARGPPGAAANGERSAPHTGGTAGLAWRWRHSPAQRFPVAFAPAHTRKALMPPGAPGS